MMLWMYTICNLVLYHYFFFIFLFDKDYVMRYVVEGIVDMFNSYYGDGVLIRKLHVHIGFK